MTTPTDSFYASQWHFPLIGDIETIWDEFTGNGVTVAVYDDGVQSSHADLDGNYDASLHWFFDDPSDMTPALVEHTGALSGLDDRHGTAVAGIIAAENDGTGTVGVAYGATLMAVNIFEFFTEYDIADEAGDSVLAEAWYQVFLDSLGHAQTLDIMSNSWGRSPLFEDYQNIHDPSSDGTEHLGHYEDAAELGRGGLGTVIVQAAGNDFLNANGDSVNASRFTITVGATDEFGYTADYSNFGVSLLLTAPAASVTTDVDGTGGNDGYNDGSESIGDDDYTNTFGGTSAATPTVAGVIALMLEANPGLGWRDVQNILALSAAQTGSELDGSNPGAFEVGDWQTGGYDGGSSWNGGLQSFHGSYGFGMLDAFTAVRMAETWLEMTGVAQTSANELHVTADYDEVANGAIPLVDATFDGQDFVDGVVIAPIIVPEIDNIMIENIQVTVDITHSWGNDLQIALITPDGDAVPLFFNDGYDDTMDAGWTWTFEITALLGFESAGTWSIVVTDIAGGDTGTLNDFQIDFYGQAFSDDSIHIITRDFLDFTAFDLSRAVLQDTNGGIDWLNFVGVNADGVGSGDVVLDMAGGGAFSVDGVAWGSLQAGAAVFENVVLGDGDDDVYGNGLNNQMLGMRGDDTLRGYDGVDDIDGGAGNDTLNGGNGSDVIDGGDGDDTISGSKGGDVIDGGAGVDTINGGDGDDTIAGGSQADIINGDDGKDTITGDDGADEIRGGKSADIIDGGTGSDEILGGAGSDDLAGGDGGDIISGQSGTDIMNGGAGDDIMNGGAGDDIMDGGNDNDIMNGGKNDDTMNGGKGADVIDGEEGRDILNGNGGSDDMSGSGGNDTMNGGSGGDTLNGGKGNDIITGGTGGDTFVFDLDSFGDDTITDLEAIDTIEITNSFWGNLSESDFMAAYATTTGSGSADVLITLGTSEILIENATLIEVENALDLI